MSTAASCLRLLKLHMLLPTSEGSIIAPTSLIRPPLALSLGWSSPLKNSPLPLASSTLVRHFQANLRRPGCGKRPPSTLCPCSSRLPTVNLHEAALPPRWHEVQVCTIPKVAIVKLPKQLRPISLLHPGGKVLATMIARRVLRKVKSYLQHTPQCAYLPGRSTGDALEAVCAHLSQARDLAQSSTTSLLQRYDGHSSKQLGGGISVSLDIHKAFDSLPHAVLLEAMQAASFDQSEIALVMHLHDHAALSFGAGTSAQVFLGSGVRQGRSLSPPLWALTALITGDTKKPYQLTNSLKAPLPSLRMTSSGVGSSPLPRPLSVLCKP